MYWKFWTKQQSPKKQSPKKPSPKKQSPKPRMHRAVSAPNVLTRYDPNYYWQQRQQQLYNAQKAAEAHRIRQRQFLPDVSGLTNAQRNAAYNQYFARF